MNTAPPPATSRPQRAPADEPIAEESLSAHARRTLLTRVRARIAAFLDAGIALLQGLRKKVGGAQDAGEDEDRPGSKRERPEARKRTAPPDEAAAEFPKPRRRLRAFLIYVSVMLAGGTGGGALAYNQFQKQLGQLLEESLRQEAALVKKIKPGAKTLETFEKERARRAEAEKKRALSLAEYSSPTTEKQKQLGAVEKQLAMVHAGEASRNVQQQAPASRRSDSSKSRPARSGNCTLNTKNIDTLKSCIDDFNQ